jgi:hypothetical protein
MLICFLRLFASVPMAKDTEEKYGAKNGKRKALIRRPSGKEQRGRAKETFRLMLPTLLPWDYSEPALEGLFFSFKNKEKKPNDLKN